MSYRNSSNGNRGSKEKTATQQLIKQNVDSLIQQLEAGHSDALTAYLTAMSRFHNYSFGNILEIARQKPDATRVAGMYAWNQLGRRVKKGEHGIRILAPIIGVKRKPQQEAEKDLTKQNVAVLVGFRNAYVFDRLSRDFRPAWPATVRRRRTRVSCVRLDGGSHIIAQFAGPLQGGLDTNEFQFAGGDLSGWFVVSSGGVKAALTTGEHASEDGHGTLLRLSMGAAKAKESFGAVFSGGKCAEVSSHVA